MPRPTVLRLRLVSDDRSASQLEAEALGALEDVSAEVYVEPEPPCTCPIGFGQVADPRCPRHAATARHTITGPDHVLGRG